MKLYGKDKVILRKKFYIRSPQAINLDIKKLLKNNKINEGKIIWYTLETEEKNIICKHIHLSDYGHVCADHSF